MLLISNKTKNIIKLLLIVATFVMPLIIAHYVFYYGNIQGSTSNKGNLVKNPHSISELNLVKPQLAYSDKWLNNTWHILYRIPNACDQDCLDVLHKMQQVHIALGKNKDRIQRVNVHHSSVNYDINNLKIIYERFPHMTMVSTSSFDDQETHTWFSSENIYIADPHGNIILSYDLKQQNFDQQLFKDTQKLLKISQIG